MLPQTTSQHHLISLPSKLIQDDYADQIRSLILGIPYNPSSLPDGVSLKALTIAWWIGESWQDVPSAVNEETNLVTAEIGHLSTFAAARSRLKEMAALERYFNDGYVRGPFTIPYTTHPPAEQSSFWPWSTEARV